MPASAIGHLVRRALFGIRAARRIATSVIKAKPDQRREKLTSALNLEKARFQSHRLATKRRDVSADVVKAMSEQYGPTLSWRAVIDEKTTKDCAFMNGKNFSVNDPPAVGLPGAVHPFCRCSVGPSIADAEFVTSQTRIPT